MATNRKPGMPAPAAPLTAVADVKDQVGAVAVLGREEAEIRGAIAAAKHFPRDEASAAKKIVEICTDPLFAEDAEYNFKRGKKEVDGQWVDNFVDGLSVEFAREAARVWGNIRYGIRILSADGDYIHVRGAAVDLETNTLAEFEDKFRNLIYRRSDGWIKPDERDLRELVNRRGAICVRNAVLGVLPERVKRDAHATIKSTKHTAANSALNKDREKATAGLVASFGVLRVTREMLEAYLGHPLSTMTAQEYATLSGVGRSIKDGNTTVADQFSTKGNGAPTSPAQASVSADDLPGVGPSAVPPSEHPSAAKKVAQASAAEAEAPSTAPARTGRLF